MINTMQYICDAAEQKIVDDGDTLYLTKTSNGYEISAFDPDFANKIEIARQGIKKYRKALIELAK